MRAYVRVVPVLCICRMQVSATSDMMLAYVDFYLGGDEKRDDLPPPQYTPGFSSLSAYCLWLLSIWIGSMCC